MLSIVLATSIITARAQSSVTTIEYNKTMQPALVLELPNTTNDVEGTILGKLKQIDEKGLAEKIKKYQSDLSNNLNNQKDQQQDIENQQKMLESLILKRKG